MVLKPLIQKNEIRHAYTLLEKQMNSRATKVKTILGWKGENKKFTVHWHHDLRMWHYYDSEYAENRYWCPYGVDDPNEIKMVGITVEINFNYQGYGRRVAGTFISDDNGDIYLAHSGKVGGGRRGIGKEAFWKFYRGNQIVSVRWPDKVDAEVICIGKIGSPSLPAQIAHFVNEVARFKQSVTNGSAKLLLQEGSLTNPKFTPEFTGKRRGYLPHDTIESVCNHGLIVSVLSRILEDKGFHAANDRFRDLYLYDDDRHITTLFEIKTDISTSSTYTSIGQLLFHGVSQDPRPRLILVIPGTPDARTKKVLNKLNIEILGYSLSGSEPEFLNLGTLLK